MIEMIGVVVIMRGEHNAALCRPHQKRRFYFVHPPRYQFTFKVFRFLFLLYI